MTRLSSALGKEADRSPVRCRGRTADGAWSSGPNRRDLNQRGMYPELKTMIASAQVAHLARRAADFGVETQGVSMDMAAVRERKRAIVESFRLSARSESRRLLGSILSAAKPTSLGLRRSALHFRTVGSTSSPIRSFLTSVLVPRPHRCLGLRRCPCLDSTSIMELDVISDHLPVVGGEFVGLEFSQMFRRFGYRVTVVQRGTRSLAREDDAVADAIVGILREDGIEVLLEAEACAVERSSDCGIRLTIRGPNGKYLLAGSHLLVSRWPRFQYRPACPRQDWRDDRREGIHPGR